MTFKIMLGHDLVLKEDECLSNTSGNAILMSYGYDLDNLVNHDYVLRETYSHDLM